MTKHVILVLAANPQSSSPLKVAEECAERSGELVTGQMIIMNLNHKHP
jgi:hypothetical protein